MNAENWELLLVLKIDRLFSFRCFDSQKKYERFFEGNTKKNKGSRNATRQEDLTLSKLFTSAWNHLINPPSFFPSKTVPVSSK